MKNLGVANSWGDDTPKELQDCIARGHDLKTEKIGHPNKGLKKISCDICKIFYKIDSSG